MTTVTPLEAILTRFLDSRESLSEEEFARLLEALRTEPRLAERLKDHLLMEELLAQRYVLDRQDFVGKIQERLREEMEYQSRTSPPTLSKEPAETYALRRPEHGQSNGTGTRTAVNDQSALRKEAEPPQNEAKSAPAPPEKIPPAASGGRPWRTLFGVLAGLLLVAGGLLRLEYTEAARRIGKVDEVAGMVVIYRNGVGMVAAAGMPILPGDEIRVQQNADFKLSFRDQSRVRISANSKVTFQPGAGHWPGLLTSGLAKTIFIHEGRLEADVSPQRPGKPMVIETREIEAQLLGTRLIVSVDSDQSRLEVIEGRVAVKSKNQQDPPAEISPGHQVIAGSDDFLVSPGDWPANSEGVLFLLSPEAVISHTPNEGVWLFAVGPEESKSILRPRREAAFVEGRMEFRGGAFLAEDETASQMLAACQETNAFSLEATFQTFELSQTGPACWATFSTSLQGSNFSLIQEGNQCVFRLLTSRDRHAAQLHKIPLFAIPDDQPHHLVVSYGDDQLRCYLDGNEVPLSADVRGTFAVWTSGHLLFGDEWTGGRDWKGAISGVAIYNRILSADEAARNSLHYKLRFQTDEQTGSGK